jgi:hypothetical protein
MYLIDNFYFFVPLKPILQVGFIVQPLLCNKLKKLAAKKSLTVNSSRKSWLCGDLRGSVMGCPAALLFKTAVSRIGC